MSIKRYDLIPCDGDSDRCYAHMDETTDGDWVLDADANAEIARLTAEVTTLRARCDTLARLVYLYRHGVPLGHQPHMIASEADKALKEPTDG